MYIGASVYSPVFAPDFFLLFYTLNLVPHSAVTFSYLRHLARGGVICQTGKIVIIIKWSKQCKTITKSSYFTVLKILKYPLCPTLTPKGAYLPLL